jgi:hypothetical protein
MTILHLTLILAAIYPLLLFWDYRTARNPETGEYKAQRISESLTLFAPFALLYYHEAFWHNLMFYFIPLYIYFLLLALVMQKKFKLASAFDMLLVVSGGSFMLSMIGYYIFFHQGAFAPAPEVVETIEQTQTGLWIWWPLAAAILAAVSIVILLKIISEKMHAVLLFSLAFVLLVLPFFSHHPYWAMLLSTVLFFYTAFAAAKQSGSSGSGAYAALFFFYMLAQFFALMVYAFLF